MARLKFWLLAALLLTACAPTPAPEAQPEIVRLSVTAAAEAWLTPFYDCAAQMPEVALMRVTPAEAEIRVQVGEPEFVTGAAWQVGVITLAVALPSENGLTDLDAAQIETLFRGWISSWSDLGGADVPVTLWLFPPGSDLTLAFRRQWLGGAPVSSSVRWAAEGGLLAEQLFAPGAVGVLPLDDVPSGLRAAARWDEPVLALTDSAPSELALQLISCVQSKKR